MHACRDSSTAGTFRRALVLRRRLPHLVLLCASPMLLAAGRVDSRCAGLVPGTVSYLLRCPGGYPLTTPWIIWPMLGLVALGASLALRKRWRAVALRGTLPPLVFPPPPPAAASRGGASSGADAVRGAGAGLPPPLESVPGPQALAYPAAWREAEPGPAAREVLGEAATIQLLPGRLRIVAGAAQEREFRFPRLPGRMVEVTIGRQGGEAPSHIQLAAPTVSRLHARMRFEGGCWRIENLSQTNPLVINGQEVAAGMLARILRDGDRLEIGEFILEYHER